MRSDVELLSVLVDWYRDFHDGDPSPLGGRREHPAWAELPITGAEVYRLKGSVGRVAGIDLSEDRDVTTWPAYVASRMAELASACPDAVALFIAGQELNEGASGVGEGERHG